MTEQEIEDGRSPAGGFTKATLASWGVPWPPPKGWQLRLLRGEDFDDEPASSKRATPCAETELLHEVMMAVINAGHGDILKGIESLNAYYGGDLPTVEDVIGGRPRRAIITGGISFDDLVYSFTCARSIR